MTQPAGPAAVETQNITKRFGKRVVLDDVSIRVEKADFFGIIGPNGAGKTTLINTILGAIAPTSGSVRILGLDPRPRNVEILSRIGVQPQRSAFFTRSTAHEHLSTVAAMYGADSKAVDSAFESMGLDEIRNIRVDKLSGGQQQRLAIASAIVHAPEVLFLDEPTAALDTRGRHDLLDELRKFKAQGTTLVYTTHHLDEVQRICNRVAIVEHGRLVATGSPKSLIDESGLPPTILLPFAQHQIDAIAAMPSVTGWDVVPDGVRVTVAGVAEAFDDFRRADILLGGAEVRPVGLEQVFLQLTGREYTV